MDNNDIKVKREAVIEEIAFSFYLAFQEETDYQSVSMKEARATWRFGGKPWLRWAKDLAKDLSSLGVMLVDKEAELPMLEKVDITGWDEDTKARIIERRIGVHEGQQSMLDAKYHKAYPLEDL